MPATLQNSLKYYLEQLKLFRAFSSAQALLSWDRETYMPKGASNDRGETVSVLAGFAHELFTDKKFVSTVQKLAEHVDELTPEQARSVILTKKELDKSVKLSKEFVEETNTIMNASQAAWLEAKQASSFAIFEPHLEKVIENRKQYAAFLSSETDPYDVLLDDYEEGLTTAYLEPLFRDLKSGLKKILPQAVKKFHSERNPLNNLQVDHQNLRGFLEEMVSSIGFDLEKGTLAHVEHPFEIGISANDVRLNTRFDKDENSFTIMGMIHELGHGLYEQNIDPRYTPLSLDHGVSLGIHESQSRLLENMIGRSTAFWTNFLPLLQAKVKEFQLVQLDEVVSALNTVCPSLIRTEADEVTYNLHIVLRFELEKELMTNQVKVKDLPEIWQAKMTELIGVAPTTDKDGVLQDVHWSWGSFGYFPTYTLGNLNAAQLFAAFQKDHPQWQTEVAVGNFRSYFSWFKEHIWQHGSFYTPAEVMHKATGEKTNAKYLLSYLENKYL